MAEIDLLIHYPRSKRKVEERAQEKNPEDIRIARQFGKEFFDGPRSQGYGGYRDDGRWVPVAEHIIKYYGLMPGMSILDVGCAKGYCVADFQKAMPELHVAGIDVSEYAIDCAPPSVRPFLKVASAEALPYPDKSFDFVLSVNSVHNLELEKCKQAIREIQRVSRRYAFLTVDAYRTQEERRRMMMWNLTANTYMHTAEWKHLFDEVGYSGDYYWFIP